MPSNAPEVNLQPAYYVHGDVEIDREVAIASGVILTADPGCRLIIARGACIGPEVVIHGRQGDLIIEPEAALGSGVLIVGRGRVGAQACVGAGSTLINPQLSPRAVVAPRSVVGDFSRREGAGEPARAPEAPAPASPAPENAASTSAPEQSSIEAVAPEAETAAQAAANNGHSNGHNSNGAGFSHVYGRDQVQQLLTTLFPHRQSLGTPPSRSE